MKMLLGPLFLAFLGASSAIGGSLVPRSPQNSDPTTADQKGTSPSSPLPSNENKNRDELLKWAPLALGTAVGAGAAAGWVVRGLPSMRFKFDTYSADLVWMNAKIREAKRANIRPDDPFIEMNGLKMTLKETTDYVATYAGCRAKRLTLIRVLKGDDYDKIVKHLGNPPTFNALLEELVKECKRQAAEWIRTKDDKALEDPQPWEDVWLGVGAYDRPAETETTARRVKVRRRKGTGKTPPQANPFTLESAKQFFAGAPMAAQQFASTVREGTPGAINNAAAGVMSSSLRGVQNLKPAKVPAGL
ncbi:MAG: hypothetical protein M1823_005609 [Watsoniomyces obsoletus]|nr:MAG: hypothetical protein M1823_005609 [Watsoniomyces obsoletus]